MTGVKSSCKAGTANLTANPMALVVGGCLLPLFKFWSMSGGIIFHQGDPIAWIAVQQEQSSLSSCEAENQATNEFSKMVLALRHLMGSIRDSGHDIPDTLKPSLVYNDNESCDRFSSCVGQYSMVESKKHYFL